MLADLSLVGCYNMSTVPEKKRAQLLLESAKKNLRDMAFFGLTEYQRKTQFLFERTFRLRFIRPFMQYNSTRAAGVDLDNATVSPTAQSPLVDLVLHEQYLLDKITASSTFTVALSVHKTNVTLIMELTRLLYYSSILYFNVFCSKEVNSKNILFSVMPKSSFKERCGSCILIKILK